MQGWLILFRAFFAAFWLGKKFEQQGGWITSGLGCFFLMRRGSDFLDMASKPGEKGLINSGMRAKYIH
jgi:hypothetical protein